jgi:hypothetical protein
MNLEFEPILYGLICIVGATIARLLDKPRSARKKKQPLGLSESMFKGGYISLFVAGVAYILWGYLANLGYCD